MTYTGVEVKGWKTAMTSDKRRFKRISVELPVTVYFFDNKGKTRLGDAIAGRINNFSPVGAALTVASILLDGKHLFYTCQDNPGIMLELVFALDEKDGKIINVPAAPVWFDRDLDSDKKQFVIGLEFLLPPKSKEIKSLCCEACQDETLLISLWKKLF